MKMMKKTLMMICATAMFATMTSCGSNEAPTSDNGIETHEHAGKQYACPMDCENGKTYDADGTCPVCKMDLKAVE